MPKKRCHFLDEDGNRCYRETTRTIIVFLDEKLHSLPTWISTDICDFHYDRLHREGVYFDEEKIQ